jgi:glucosylceramidase
MADFYMKRIVTNLEEHIFFEEEQVKMNQLPPQTEGSIINFYDDVRYQEILGFGGSFTESSAYLYSRLPKEQKQQFLELYFDEKQGIGYNFGRTHINSCDFSLGMYTSVQEGDETLSSFNLKREKQYIIPFLKDVLAYSKQEVVLFASPWSPPAYMKDNGNMCGGGKLLAEYKTLWAQYYAKYMKAMAEEGIKIHAISVQNEPNASQLWESCNYSAQEEQEFIAHYLMEALDSQGLGDVKIIIWDHNKERIYDRAKTVLQNPGVNKRVWAVAHHWYSGFHFEGLRLVHEQLGKPTFCSEFCGPITQNVDDLAQQYGIEMCGNLNHYDIASCDWNLLLDQKGGPYHNRTANISGTEKERKDVGCYAPILYDTNQKALVVTPIYYVIGHFSKFIKRGAVRVATTTYHPDLHVCGFVNPDGSRVCVILNPTDHALPAVLRYQGACTETNMKPHSVVTLVF